MKQAAEDYITSCPPRQTADLTSSDFFYFVAFTKVKAVVPKVTNEDTTSFGFD